MCEHRRSTEQVFAAVPVTACDPFMTVDGARQKLRVFRERADTKERKLSVLLLPPFQVVMSMVFMKCTMKT